MYKLIIVLALIIFFNNVYGQKELLDDFNRMLDVREVRITELEKEVKKAQEETDNVLKQKSIDTRKLSNALRKLSLANLQLQKSRKQLHVYKDKLSQSQNQVQNLNKKVEDLEKTQKSYDSILLSNLNRQGKETFYKKAQEEAEREFALSEQIKPKEGFLKKLFKGAEPLMFVTTGYRFQGFIFHGSVGATFNQDKNIYVGIGSGYDEFVHNGKFGLIPFYLSTKVVINNPFIQVMEDKSLQMHSDVIGYLLCDVGYGMLQNKENINISSGGLFANIGFGISANFGNNLSGIAELSFRRQSVVELTDNSYKRQSFNVPNLKVGVGIYIY